MGLRLIVVLGLVALLAVPGAALAHPANSPPLLIEPPEEVETIPERDRDFYVSRVTKLKPAVPGLGVRILGGDERLELTWTGSPPLTVLGTQGEPMIRMGTGGVEVNLLSPSLYLTGDRYGDVAVPANVNPTAPPRWRRLDSPGAFSWFEHRIHWLESERPPIVGDGTKAATVFHWRVPLLLGDRSVEVVGSLDWVPDPAAIRAMRSDVSSPLLSALILLGALALGAGVGFVARPALERRGIA